VCRICPNTRGGQELSRQVRLNVKYGHNQWIYLFCLLALFQSAGSACADQGQATGVSSDRFRSSTDGITSGAKKETKDKGFKKMYNPQAGSLVNSVDNMQDNHKNAGAPKEQGNAAKERKFDAETPIGDAWLDDAKTIHVRLRRTADGINVSGEKTYALGSEYYEKVIKHLGGLKPGEVKLMLPWKQEEY